MKPYLVFRLYGSMASWGLPAVGGDRQTAVYPSRSAILGLLGAAMGIKRDDMQGLKALQQSVIIAVKQMVPSSLIRDYHTTQVPVGSPKELKHCNTRKAEIDEYKRQEKTMPKNKKPNAILSSRDYRCDGLWVVAVSLTEQATVDLDTLRSALLTPVYPLSLGRKSCPLALPMMSQIVENCTLKQALDTKFPTLTNSEKADSLWLGSDGWVTYFWPGDKNEMGEKNVSTTHPWDEPESRDRWQFKQRVMHQLSMHIDDQQGDE